VLSVKTPWQWLRGVVQEGADAPEHGAAAVQAWSSEPLLAAQSASERSIQPVRFNRRNGPAADHMLLLTLYAHCVQASTVFLTDSLVTQQR
jgi:hypothetical protein